MQKVAKCKNDEIFILIAKWINGEKQKVAKCENCEIRLQNDQMNKWPNAISGQVKKLAKCKNDEFFLLMVKWINGQTKSVSKWKKWQTAKMMTFLF